MVVFTVQDSGDLCFSIIPLDSTSDYNWALFDLDHDSALFFSCSQVFSNPFLELSCNNVSVPGITGANGDTSNISNEPCVQVFPGHRMFLYVSDFLGNAGGFDLIFHSSALIEDLSSPRFLGLNYDSVAIGTNQITLTFSEPILSSSFSASDLLLIFPDSTTSQVDSVWSPFSYINGYAFQFIIKLPNGLNQIGTYELQLVGSIFDRCSNIDSIDSVSFKMLPIFSDGDCLGAISLCSNSYQFYQNLNGEGFNPNEIKRALSCLGGEQNGIWFSLEAQNSGQLCFTIVPVNPVSDYDWAVYNCVLKNLTQQI